MSSFNIVQINSKYSVCLRILILFSSLLHILWYYDNERGILQIRSYIINFVNIIPLDVRNTERQKSHGCNHFWNLYGARFFAYELWNTEGDIYFAFELMRQVVSFMQQYLDRFILYTFKISRLQLNEMPLLNYQNLNA